jgi:AbrB family looped-hinge helix DNA binding protein
MIGIGEGLGQYRTNTEDQGRRQYWLEWVVAVSRRWRRSDDGLTLTGTFTTEHGVPYRCCIRHTKPVSMEYSVDVVTISPKYQVVIPRAVREQLNLVPGQKVQAIVYDGRLQLIPLRAAAAFRGTLAGLDTTLSRDTDRV